MADKTADKGCKIRCATWWALTIRQYVQILRTATVGSPARKRTGDSLDVVKVPLLFPTGAA